ncbi:MAG: hypothetical protein JRG80_01430 [Deltaproteobacteria bacterium]|nr:hypothetical protein [Deltaproteobacteria bacterium]MBW2397914.1 hypothetical protein [Deltaproteobacteria bacterium]MBW2665104.1 hypothetical protein [Deltaproteobacteria bacterium]
MEFVIVAQGLAGALYLLTVLIVGSRLVMLARRTKQLPELLLGGGLLLGGVLGGPLEASAISLRAEIEHAIAGKLLLAGKIAGIAALICHATFIRRVFRPHERWAWWLVAFIIACPVATLFGYGAHGAFATSEIPWNWFWIDLSARITSSTWLVVEGAIYYGMMKRRLRLGLAEPLVTNRFLLWTMAGGLSIVMFLTSVPPMLLDPVADASLLTLDLFVFSIAGVGISALYFLTFLPPESFRRWIGETSEAVS